MTATVTIAVPSDAASGEQYGVVWAEARSAPGAGGGVIQVSRVGIRLYVSVGPGGPPRANFAIDSLTAERAPDGRPTVVAAVHNTGRRALDLNGTLQLLSGPGGLQRRAVPRHPRRHAGHRRHGARDDRPGQAATRGARGTHG